MTATLYISKKHLDYDTLESVIKSHSIFGDVDCTIYRSRSFTSWDFENSAKIEFFNMDSDRLWNIYLALREYCGINCAVLDQENYFGCIVKSPLNKKKQFTCSDD